VPIFYPRYKVKKSLKLSILDGSAVSAMLGLTQNYVTPFALALKATTAQIGLLTSIPNFLMGLSQLTAPDLSEKAGSRKGLILPVVFLHALLWIPILLVPFIFKSAHIWWLIGFVTLNTVLGAAANPAWGSMMADLVPPRLRGKYFALRGRIAGIITLVFSLIGGGILQLLSGSVYIGFAVLFGGAALFRLISLYFLSGMYEPPEAKKQEKQTGLIQRIKHIGSTNLGKFTLYVSLINFAANISSPFFPVYMLEDLHFNYTAYIINISAFSIAVLVFQSYWGRRGDWAGNIKVVRVTSYLVPIVPLLWLGSTNQIYLIAAQLFSGFSWAGFNLASVNFVYDASNPENRTQDIAIYNTMTGLSICLGALAGGYIEHYLPPIFSYRLLTLFTISGVLRAVVAFWLFHFLHEVRPVPHVSDLRTLLGRAVRK
jgi:MFS family permease